MLYGVYDFALWCEENGFSYGGIAPIVAEARRLGYRKADEVANLIPPAEELGCEEWERSRLFSHILEELGIETWEDEDEDDDPWADYPADLSF